MKIDVITIFPRMVEPGSPEGVVGRARPRGIAGHRRPQPARLHDRQASRRGRCAVWRRAGHGDEARAVLRGAGGDSGRARRAGCGGAAVAGRARFTQDGARGWRRIGARGAAVRALRRDRRAGARGARDGGDVDRRLRAVGRRGAGAGGDRRGRRGWCPAWSATISRWRRIRSRAACSTTRTTRGPRSSRDGRCPTCCCRGIMPRFGGGGARRRCGGRWNGGRTCWRRRRSTPTNESG